MGNSRFEFLLITERYFNEVSVVLLHWHTFFCVHVLSSSGKIDPVYESPHIQCIEETDPWWGRSIKGEHPRYTKLLKEYYLDLNSKGWKPIDQKPFSPRLYRESSDPHGKSLEELMDILNQILLFSDNARFLDENTKRLLIKLGRPLAYKKGDALEALEKGMAVVKEFYEMISELKKIENPYSSREK